MKLDIRGRNIEVTDALKDYTTKRLSKLDKFLDETRTAQVAMSLEGEKHKEKHKVEVTIPLNGLIVRAEVGADDMYSAIDLVVEKLDKQIDKHKTKLYRRYRTAGLRQAVAGEPKPLDLEKEYGDRFPVVKTKRFVMKPMDTEEAIMQMSLLGHNFFMFYNANTGTINVVYKRLDGNYGLIEPD